MKSPGDVTGRRVYRFVFVQLVTILGRCPGTFHFLTTTVEDTGVDVIVDHRNVYKSTLKFQSSIFLRIFSFT